MLLQYICTKEGFINVVMDFATNFEFIDCSLSFVYVQFNDSIVSVNFMESFKTHSILIRPYK